MTEPVRPSSLTRTPLGPIQMLAASAVATSLILALPPAVLAAPAAEDTPPAAGDPTEAEASEPPADLPAVEDVETALAEGDLTTARELAVARREGDPSAANYVLEARVWEALGDYENAKLALEAALEQLAEDSDERVELEAELAELEAVSRGTVADEPPSTHREALDQARAERLAALAPKPPPPDPIDAAPARKPIVKQWYFWVTLGAIVASAGAIVGLAASNALDERSDDAAAGLGRAPTRRPVVPAGGVVFRF